MEYQKYVKYKIKYLNLKYGNNQYGGVLNNIIYYLLLSMQANDEALKTTYVNSPNYNNLVEQGIDYEKQAYEEILKLLQTHFSKRQEFRYIQKQLSTFNQVDTINTKTLIELKTIISKLPNYKPLTFADILKLPKATPSESLRLKIKYELDKIIKEFNKVEQYLNKLKTHYINTLTERTLRQNELFTQQMAKIKVLKQTHATKKDDSSLGDISIDDWSDHILTPRLQEIELSSTRYIEDQTFNKDKTDTMAELNKVQILLMRDELQKSTLEKLALEEQKYKKQIYICIPNRDGDFNNLDACKADIND